VQSRYGDTGWYGIGSALERYAEEHPNVLNLLQKMYQDWPFFHTVLDNAQLELVRAHLPTAALYASRVRPRSLGEAFHQRIEEEYRRTSDWMLKITGQKELLENSVVVRRTVELRNPAVEPLSRLQVALLERWDRNLEEDPSRNDAWKDTIPLSIIGIAAAMQSTG
jgi:phosphoenolpyruvate carboxylase